MKEELRSVKKEFATERLTDIHEEITDIKIDTSEMIAKEDVIVTLTKDGYIKRTTNRSYTSSNTENPQLKDLDYMIGMYELNTMDTLIIFTTLGNYLYIPVHTIPQAVWKDPGKHVSNIVKLEQDEQVVSAIPVVDFDSKDEIIIATENGMIKKTSISEFKTQRYSKPICSMKLKEKDKVVSAFKLTSREIFVATRDAFGLWFDSSEIPLVGLKASGVKSINLKNDKVVSVTEFDKEKIEYVTIITEKGTAKRVKLSEFDKSSRAKRGLMILREVKTNPYKVLKVFTIDTKHTLGIKGSSIDYSKITDLAIADRYSTGSSISKMKLTDSFIVTSLLSKKDFNNTPNIEKKTDGNIIIEKLVDVPSVALEKKKEEPEKKKEKVSLKEIDDRLLTIEDFLNSD
jgi:topoisomerase-4 subunit A